MAIPFTILAWELPWPEKPGALQSLGSQGQRRLTDRAQHSFDTRHLETYVIHFNSCKAFPTKSTVYWIIHLPVNGQLAWHPTPVPLPGKSHGRRSLVGFSPWGRWESGTTERLHFHFSLSCIGEGNGNPLQRSYLENPRDGGTWCAAAYGVTQNWTRLKRLSSSSSIFSAFFPLEKKQVLKQCQPWLSWELLSKDIYCALLLFMYKAVLITGHLKSLLTIQVESIEILPCLDDKFIKNVLDTGGLNSKGTFLKPSHICKNNNTGILIIHNINRDGSHRICNS